MSAAGPARRDAHLGASAARRCSGRAGCDARHAGAERAVGQHAQQGVRTHGGPTGWGPAASRPSTDLMTADGLRAQTPQSETLHAHPWPALLGGNAGEHAGLWKPVDAADHVGRIPPSVRHDRSTGRVPRLRCLTQAPLHASNAHGHGHGSASWTGQGEHGLHCRWGTDLRVSQRHVSRRLRGGRARGNMAQETGKPRNTQGDPCAHPEGQGRQPLSVVLTRVMRLACLVEQTQPRCGAWLPAVWGTLGSLRRLGERIRVGCYA